MKDLEPFFLFYLLMKLSEVLRSLVFNAAADGYNPRRALNSTHAAADAPILIDPGFIFNHFDSIYRANISTGPTADAFTQFGFTNKINRH